MDRAAQSVMDEYPDVVLGFGESDEYSCVPDCAAAGRHAYADRRRPWSLVVAAADPPSPSPTPLCRFLIRRKSNLYSRRESKLVSLLVSLFTSAYVFYWPTYFPRPSPAPPSTDALPPALDYPSSFERLADVVQPPTAADQGTLLYPPTFDGRVVCYPTEREVRDYFAWRQVDSASLPFFLRTPAHSPGSTADL